MAGLSRTIMQRLTGKICVVTGAARGIGRAIAARFHEEGGIVVVSDIDEDAGAATAAAIGCRFETLDVREEGDGIGWQRAFRLRMWWSTMPG